MTTPDTAVTLARLEGKLDTLAVKVDAGDRAAAQLVELVKTELANVQQSVLKLEATVKFGLDRADSAVSTVRTDLQAQIRETFTDLEAKLRDVRAAEALREETQAQERRRIYARLEQADAWRNRLVGGMTLASGLGVSGFVALIRGW